MYKVIAACAFALFVPCAAIAADLPVKAVAPPPVVPVVYDWTGFYVGGHLGYAWTTQSMSATDNAAVTAVYGGVPTAKGISGGLHAGYDYQFPNRIVIGLALEVNGLGIKSVTDSTGLAGTNLESTIDWEIATYGRLGYAFDRVMPYALFGVSWNHDKVTGNNGFIGSFSADNWHTGWTAGAGVEYLLAQHWSAYVYYRYVDSNTQTYLNRAVSGTGSIVAGGVSYRF